MNFRIPSKKHLEEWHDKFVWFPWIIRDYDTEKRHFVWLETIRCRKIKYNMTDDYVRWVWTLWQYKLKD